MVLGLKPLCPPCVSTAHLPHSLGLLGLLFVLGLLTGVALAVVGLWWLVGLGLFSYLSATSSVHRPSSGPTRSQIHAGYLHEQSTFIRGRKH